jgi:calcineurin-like phosphoesterase family protein
MKRYFIADTHFGHEALVRGMLRRYPHSNELFPSVEAYDEHVIGAINAAVGVNDELHVLGDFSQLPGKYRARIKCKHVMLTRGNHDPVQKSKNVFGEIPWMREVKLRGDTGSLTAILSHAPQAYWIGSHRGWAHLYGHTHGQREDTLDQAFGRERRAFDVGADHLRTFYGNYFPVDEAELYAMLIDRKGHDQQSYYHEFQRLRDIRLGFDEED